MLASGPSDRYWLSSHVSLCRTPDYFVLLDRRRNRYLGAPTSDMLRLATRIHGWPWADSADCEEVGSNDGQARELLADLLEWGALTTRSQREGLSLSVPIDRATEPLIEGYAAVPCRVTVSDVLHFLWSTIKASAYLHVGSFDRLVERIHARNRLNRLRARGSQTQPAFSLDRARTQLAIFRRLRAVLFTTSQACLFSTLVLEEFLSRQQLFAQFVFGVKTNPFAAHCWLQHGCIVIDDTPENVGLYTPILVL